MGFVLRSVFWLTLASIVVPVHARFGYDGRGADGQQSTIGEQMHDTAYAVWSLASEISKTCEANPAFCDAGKNLIGTVSDTGTSLLQEARAQLSAPRNPRFAEASPQTQQHKKFQDRIE
jgi:hypothetical protein